MRKLVSVEPGQRFSRLTALEPVVDSPRHLWRCRCDCGAWTTVVRSALAAGKVRSCGCLRRESASENGRRGRRSESDIWARVDRSAGHDACWPWTGATYSTGYGRAMVGRKTSSAHRWVMMFELGRELTPAEFVCHRCDNPPCCNPAHLFLGTAKVNHDDMLAKGRRSKHIPPPKRGPHNATAKLTNEQATEIRLRHSRGETISSLSRAFGVARPSIRAIVRRTAYVEAA